MRVTERILQFGAAELVWARGVLLHIDDEFMLISVSVQPEENNSVRSIIRLTAFAASGEVPVTVFRMVVLSLENLCNDWFGKLRERATVLVPCPKCISNNRGDEIYHFNAGTSAL